VEGSLIPISIRQFGLTRKSIMSRITSVAALFCFVLFVGCSNQSRNQTSNANIGKGYSETVPPQKTVGPSESQPKSKPKRQNETVPAPIPTNQSPESRLPQTVTVRYQGRDAQSWARDLMDADYIVSRQGAIALQQIGREGLRFVVQGMKSERESIRFNSVNLLDYGSAKQYKDVFLPLLTNLLEDESGRVRQFAAVAFLDCAFKEGIDAMKKAHDREKDPMVKADIGRYLQDLTKK
jgi:hypothetical protein